jgi:hypothetical protein
MSRSNAAFAGVRPITPTLCPARSAISLIFGVGFLLELLPASPEGDHSTTKFLRTIATVCASAGISRSPRPTLKQRTNPRDAFAGHTPATPWDDLHLAYFSGYAMWNYLNTPFIFALPGFTAEEIEPWIENGATWRRLKVTFPASIATHSSEQVFYIGGDGLIARLDYFTDLTGVPAAHYTSEYRDFDGIKIPTKRRAYRRNADGTPMTDGVGVAIDIADIKLS